jgi:hypothetical protein
MSQDDPKTDLAEGGIALAGGVLVVVGSVLNWAKVAVDMAGVGSTKASFSGMDLRDGKATLAIGALVIAAALAGMLVKRGPVRIGPVIVEIAGGGTAAALGVMTASGINASALDALVKASGQAAGPAAVAAREILAESAAVNAGWGLYLVILGGVVALMGGVVAAIALRNATRRRGTADGTEESETAGEGESA